MPFSLDDAFRRALAALHANNAAEGERLFREILTHQPRHVAGLNLLSIMLIQRGAFTDAEPLLARALQENKNSDATYFNYGNVLKALRRPHEALEQFNKALEINPSVPDTWNNRGAVFNDLGEYSAAIADFDRALSLKPHYPEALCNKGQSLSALGQFDTALSVFSQALARRTDLAEAWAGRGRILFRFKQYDEALGAIDAALKLKSDLKGLMGLRIYIRRHLCDWRGLNAEAAALARSVTEGKVVSDPFSFLSGQASAAEQLVCARASVAKQRSFPAIYRGERYHHTRIRVAYLSADLHDHATSYLMAGVFEQHDRSAFEISALSFGPNQASVVRSRMQDAVEDFVDCRTSSDQQIAELVREREIDIAIDLKGFTADARPEIFARRPAPLQVNYLGHPGTLGAGYMDYVVADKVVIPEDHYGFYDEKVVLLPHSYQANDNRREILETPARAACGLPESAFVFCCFNNAYKITPEMFDIWMRLLRDVDGTVLWLLDEHATTSNNLRREAANRGISVDRLVFAPRMQVGAHLARHRHADLFLDTLPYNAHTTASDALWAGLPVLTCLGTTFAGRVAGSLLKAAGLDSLVTNSLEEYEALARRIAQDRDMHVGLKTSLMHNRESCPLFDTKRFTRYLETAYAKMHELHQVGRAPQHLTIDP